MIEGLYSVSGNEIIETSLQNNGSIKLIGKGDGNEIMLQEIKKNTLAYLSPGESKELFEFIYILSGSISIKAENTEKIINSSEYFYVKGLKELVQFETLEDTKLLYISSQPVFYSISERLNELRKIAKVSQEKDLYTHNHGARVQYYSVILANRFNLGKEKVENIFFASLFHDIGKVDVPDNILNKPDKLTDFEMDIVKKHPKTGADMIKDTYYKDLSIIIEQHHEWLNGKGYPNGIGNNEICIESKIIAVADAFDAMTTSRPYRGALTQEKTIEILKSEAGWKYDGKIIDELINILKEEKNSN